LNNIVALAIHDLERIEGSTYQIRLADRQLSVTPTTQRVIDEIYDLYNRRASKSHGKFTTSEGYPTEEQIRDYLTTGPEGFLHLTSRMMETLRNQAQARSASTGGHVLFAHFQREGRDFVLVAIITDKLSAALRSQTDMQDVKHLDIDGFRFAGRINLTAWTGGDERYISFLKGKGNVSEYFKHFLGCDSVIQDRVDTSNLVSALKEFVVKTNMPEQEGNDFLGRAKAICERASRAREEIEFEALANELMPRDPRPLSEHLSHTDRALSDHFVPDRRALASLVRFKGATRQWKVEFDREAVSTGVVRYDPRANIITLTNVPDELVDQLRSEGLARD
jgi:nucleoid-associated protein